MLRGNTELCKRLQRAADSWAKERPEAGTRRYVFADISDGAIMRNHPELGEKADRSDGSLRLAFILYYDDLEVVNPLGAFHGRHQLGMFYWALVNIDASERMAFHNLHLMTVALKNDIDYYGIEQVVSGLPGDTSFGSAMTALDEGMTISISRKKDMLVRGWTVCLSADFPAAAHCLGFKQSVSAACFCRECDVNQDSDAYPTPTSFMDDNQDLLCDLCLRDRQQMLEQYAEFQKLRTKKEQNAFLASLGVNRFEGHAFTRVPLFDICTMVPYDFMHVELEGSLKNELAAMLYYFLRHRPAWKFTVEKLNRAMHNYAWPNGARPPDFTTGYLEKGTKSGQAKTGCHVHLTAGDMLRFAMHSVDIMLPLIGDTSDPLWQCWVAHIKYLNVLMQHTLTYSDILTLDRLIYEHQQLFLECTEYGARMYKPKNHFATHFSMDIYNHGPVRHYWCMRFEALNQLFKNFAKGGAFRNTCGRVSDMWCIRAAMEAYFGTRSNWGATTALEASAPVKYRRPAPKARVEHGIRSEIASHLLQQKRKKWVRISWISRLHFKGCEVTAGESWIRATYDGKPVLAFLPDGSIFNYDKEIYFLLHLYPSITSTEYGLPSVIVPLGYEAETIFVMADAPNFTDVVVLWMSHRKVMSTSVEIGFVPLQ